MWNFTRMGCWLSFLGWLFALVGCGKPCWIGSGLGRFVPSPVSVMWFSGRTLKTRNSGRKQELFPGRASALSPGQPGTSPVPAPGEGFWWCSSTSGWCQGLGMASTLLPHLHWENGIHITTRFFLLSLSPRTCSPGPGWVYPDFGASKHWITTFTWLWLH